MSKVLIIAGVSILTLGLVLGIALPGLAAPDSTSPQAGDILPKILRGKVVGIDEGKTSFIIQSGEEEVTISVDEDTKYFKLCVPGRIIALARHRMELKHQNQEGIRASARHQMGLRHQQTPQLDNVGMPEPERPKLKRLRPFGEESTFDDIAVGDRVAVRAVLGEDNPLAKVVLIIKPTTYDCVSGTIIDISSSDRTITISPDDGEAVTLYYNEGTVFILKGIIQVETGQYARAIYDSDNMIAKRVVVHQ